MRLSFTTIAALLALLAFVLVLWFRPWRDEESAGAAGGGNGSGAASSAAGGSGARIDALPPGTVALRAQAAKVDSDRITPRPTFWLRVSDQATGQPIAGAAVRASSSAASIVFTDARGLVGVPLREPEPLAVVMEGYLLRPVAMPAGTSETAPHAVTLVQDAWSWRRRFRFVTATGSAVPEAFVQFRNEVPAPNRSPVPAGDAVGATAWSEHALLAAQPVAGDLLVQPAAWSEDRAHRLGEGHEVRFAAPGDYTIAAATLDGFVGAGTLRIEAATKRAADVVTVTLQPGAFLDGAVVDASSAAALPGVAVTLQGGDPLGLQCLTEANGAFVLGPLAPGPTYLELRAGGRDPVTFGPVRVPGETVRVSMRGEPR